jgi:CHAT domain-containing protein/tetratricopeptide (TPR) repeat protein
MAAWLLFALGDNALELRDAPRAELLFDRAIRVLDQTYGPEHPWPAMARARLALAYERQGRNAQAEVLLRQAIDVIERTLGTEHPWFAQCLASLGNLRGWAGDPGKAEELALRAMAILDRIGETGSTQYAGLLNTLANLEVQKRNYPAAEALFLRALALNERIDGPESFAVSITYQNLGAVAREQKDYPKAIEYATRALSIRERVLGADHPDIAQLLNNLANIRHAQGDTPGSLELHFRALRIQEHALGPYDRGTLVSVGNIARRYAAIGDIPNAVAFQRRADTILDAQMRLQLAVGSEREKLAFMNDVSARTDRTISLSLREAATDPDARALAALVLLQRKGRVLDAMIDTFASVRLRPRDDADRVLLDQLVRTSAQLADLTLNTPAEGRSGEERARLRTLEEERERLEAALSTRSAEFRVHMAPVTLDAVQAAIPPDAALLEFAIFRPFDPKAERNTDAYGPPHYAAYVLRRDAPPRAWDLGPAAAIDGAIDALRQALRDRTRTDLTPRARAVHDRVVRPIEAAFGDATHLLISPDGALNLVPFEAMIDARGRYLIERYAIGYLSSGRDLLRRQAARASRGAPAIVADPFFGKREEATLYFAPLSGTAAEARQIQGIFPEATLLTQRGATTAALARLEGPRLLHIASHGFFVERTIREARETAPKETGGTRGMRPGIRAENPLLRSGLALAGANAAAADASTDAAADDAVQDDGILTALEAAGLNLWGTKLVTLSACDTGVGEVRNGEGVYGLRRAFLLAGAESMVMSLWPVSDYVTRRMMTTYYTGLRAGLGRGEALRRAKLAMIARGKGRRSPLRHPSFWASFIQSGEWAPLDGPP